GGRVRLGGDPLRVPHGPAAVPGADAAGHHNAGGLRRAGAAVPPAAEGAARPGDDLFEVPAQGAGQALRECGGPGGRPGAVRAGRAGAEEGVGWGGGEPIQARPVGGLERGWRWCRRNPALASALAGVLLVVATGATVATVLAVIASEARGRAEQNAGEARQEQAAAGAARNELANSHTELPAAEGGLQKTTQRLGTTAARGPGAPLLAPPPRPKQGNP